MSQNRSLQWKFSQTCGPERELAQDDAGDADAISCVEFDQTGDFVATGDKGGHITIYQQGSKGGGGKSELPHFKRYCEFQSHDPDFDYLKSLEIEERINKIKWLKSTNGAQFLLSTNDKTIKLWKVHERRFRGISSLNFQDGQPATPHITNLSVPRVVTGESYVAATPRRVFANGHAYHINSISVNSDGETYISSDDLRINLWNADITDRSFNIVDIKPQNMEDLTEVITSSEFHPQHCNIFVYSSSKGSIKMGDMRNNALCDAHTKVFEEQEDDSTKSFFSEIISSVSDVKFSHCGRYLVSRDYLTVKVWDVNMDSKPIVSIPIQEALRSRLCDLYENDCIFDRFECHFSHNSSHILTGSYQSLFHLLDWQHGIATCYEASLPKKRMGFGRSPKKEVLKSVTHQGVFDAFDYQKKILHVAWHPNANVVVIASANKLFTYHALP
eukprot:gnl/Hemi2/13222_TR4528_c0_g1_i1.p1 gnl/Hemi2/13222_TR4528_c0_g1~~gnl/Hemi2/13222_TR4528_c0_g1_i1.p1  ORF type:complete len:444 (-),score=94.08 gnl/Hemi2/13222_TR4528_c0_g1_i1:266-1597(-)